VEPCDWVDLASSHSPIKRHSISPALPKNERSMTELVQFVVLFPVALLQLFLFRNALGLLNFGHKLPTNSRCPKEVLAPSSRNLFSCGSSRIWIWVRGGELGWLILLEVVTGLRQCAERTTHVGSSIIMCITFRFRLLHNVGRAFNQSKFERFSTRNMYLMQPARRLANARFVPSGDICPHEDCSCAISLGNAISRLLWAL
jgi:hypothetical protein